MAPRSYLATKPIRKRPKRFAVEEEDLVKHEVRVVKPEELQDKVGEESVKEQALLLLGIAEGSCPMCGGSGQITHVPALPPVVQEGKGNGIHRAGKDGAAEEERD